MQEKIMYIIRGLPGSGKSSLAEILYNKTWESGRQASICEADDYQMEFGKYVWKAERVVESHKKCMDKARRSMEIGLDAVIVSNTSSREREVAPYIDMAEEFGYTVISLIVENRHGNKSVHDVPESTMEAMRNRFSVKL
ncbi:AAA family ATPase [Pseudomonas phage vFB297]|nr:AAA family ATPase [Pseudomonas phage vFB297]